MTEGLVFATVLNMLMNAMVLYLYGWVALLFSLMACFTVLMGCVAAEAEEKA